MQVGCGGPLLVGFPLLIAAVVLRSRSLHYPVLDLAMTEFRVARRGRLAHTARSGCPGASGIVPGAGSHPGPLSFWLLAPTYPGCWVPRRGRCSWGRSSSTWPLWELRCCRWGCRRGGLVAAPSRSCRCRLLVAMHGYGIGVLTQPWNPYLPLARHGPVVLLATWMTLEGDHRMLDAAGGGRRRCAAQTHVPYLLLCGRACSLLPLCVTVSLVVRESPRCRRPLRSSAGRVAGRRWCGRWRSGVVLWLPTLIDQVVHDPGQPVGCCSSTSGTHPRSPIGGIGAGLKLAAPPSRPDPGALRWATQAASCVLASDEGPSRWRPAPVLLVVVALPRSLSPRLLALRSGHRLLRSLHAIDRRGRWCSSAMSMSQASSARSGTTSRCGHGASPLLMAIAAVATFSALALLRRRAERRARPRVWRWRRRLPAVGVGRTASRHSPVDAVRCATAPEPRLSTPLGRAGRPHRRLRCCDAVGAATPMGARAAYVVTWNDARILRLAGIRARQRAGACRARTSVSIRHLPGARHLATGDRPTPTPQRRSDLDTGSYIDEVGAPADDAVRGGLRTSPAVPAEMDRVRGVAQPKSSPALESGRSSTSWSPQVDTNLFGLSLDTRVPAELHPALAPDAATIGRPGCGVHRPGRVTRPGDQVG